MAPNRALAKVVWHEDSTRIELTYVVGEPGHLTGSLEVATALAAVDGLFWVPSPEGTMCWVRDRPEAP